MRQLQQNAEGNAGQTLFSYKVSLSAASSSVQTVNWSLSGTGSSAADPASDFSGATSGSITFQIGETEKTIQIYARGDTSVEADEHFTVTLSITLNEPRSRILLLTFSASSGRT